MSQVFREAVLGGKPWDVPRFWEPIDKRHVLGMPQES